MSLYGRACVGFKIARFIVKLVESLTNRNEQWHGTHELHLQRGFFLYCCEAFVIEFTISFFLWQ